MFSLESKIATGWPKCGSELVEPKKSSKAWYGYNLILEDKKTSEVIDEYTAVYECVYRRLENYVL